MNINDIYASTLTSAHLNGADLDVTITGGEIREFKEPDGSTRKKVVLHLEGRPSLVLNKTNAVQIAATLQTPELTAWKGQAITLYADTTTYGGRSVPCIRVRDQQPKPHAPAQDAPQANDGAVRW